MAWRDNLVQASFRGVEFQVDESENEAGGRRIALHEYPGRDDPFAEDMGEITKKFSIEGFIVGDDYLDRGERLIDACNMPGPGELVHPYRGSRNVVCNKIVEAVRTREGRIARYTMSFTQAGENQYPASESSTAETTVRNALPVLDAVTAQFISSFSVEPLTRADIDGRLQEFVEAIGSPTDLIAGFGRGVLSLARGGAGFTGGLGGLSGISQSISSFARSGSTASILFGGVSGLVGGAGGVVGRVINLAGGLRNIVSRGRRILGALGF